MQTLSKAIQHRADPSLKNATSLYKYYLTQLQFRIRKIKVLLATHMQTTGPGLSKQSTIKNFQELRERKTHKSRIRGLYRYNVLDNPEFIHSKKVEAKVIKMQEKLQR